MVRTTKNGESGTGARGGRGGTVRKRTKQLKRERSSRQRSVYRARLHTRHPAQTAPVATASPLRTVTHRRTRAPLCPQQRGTGGLPTTVHPPRSHSGRTAAARRLPLKRRARAAVPAPRHSLAVHPHAPLASGHLPRPHVLWQQQGARRLGRECSPELGDRRGQRRRRLSLALVQAL